MNWPILSVMTFLPLVGALFIVGIAGDGDAEEDAECALDRPLDNSLITFAISLIALHRFRPRPPRNFGSVEKQPWLGGAVSYHMGLTEFPCLLSFSRGADADLTIALATHPAAHAEYRLFSRARDAYVGTFTALDLIVFYLFFEGRPGFRCS